MWSDGKIEEGPPRAPWDSPGHVKAAWTLVADLDKLGCGDTEGRAQSSKPTHRHPCSDFFMPPEAKAGQKSQNGDLSMVVGTVTLDQ